MSEHLPTIYALLIGIDDYKPNRLYKNLRGAVRDINLAETFVKQTLQIPPYLLYKLTLAHKEDTALLAAGSAQDFSQSIKPTYENIVYACQRYYEC